MAAINPGNVLYNDASGNPVAVAAATPLPVTSVATAGSAVIGKVGTDQTTPGTTDRVTTGDMVNISATFTRPANTTAYASGQLVANNVTAGSVTPMAFLLVSRYTGGAFRISRVRLNKSSVVVTNASFRLHLYNTVAPSLVNGDGGVWLSNGGTSYLGSVDISTDKAFTDAAAGVAVFGDNALKLASGSTIWGLLEARGAYTPTSAEVFIVILEVAQT
jgi:hypothetical protein